MEATTNLNKVSTWYCPSSQSDRIDPSLSLHKILVPYTLSILLPQLLLFRLSTRAVNRHLVPIVEQLPQPGRVFFIGKSEHG